MGGKFFLINRQDAPGRQGKKSEGDDKSFRAVLRAQKPGFLKKPGFSVPHKG